MRTTAHPGQITHYAEAAPGTLRTACGEALLQGVRASSDITDVNCWRCDFALRKSVADGRTAAEARAVAKAGREKARSEAAPTKKGVAKKIAPPTKKATPKAAQAKKATKPTKGIKKRS